MSELRKTIYERVIETATPGSPGYPGRPASPGVYSTTTVTVCGYVYYTYDEETMTPIRSPGYDPTYGDGDTTTDLTTGVTISAPGSGGFYQWECWEEPRVTYIPPEEEIPAVPPTPPTPAVIIQDLNIGWNSHSRTMDPLDRKGFLQYNLGVTGAVIGLGLKGMDDGTPGQYDHALVFDVSGIQLYEKGKVGQRLYNLPPDGAVLRIYRDGNKLNNKISYYIQIGRTIIEASVTPAISALAKLYVYSWLYTGGDRVPEADYLNGEVQFAQTQDVP